MGHTMGYLPPAIRLVCWDTYPLQYEPLHGLTYDMLHVILCPVEYRMGHPVVQKPNPTGRNFRGARRGGTSWGTPIDHDRAHDGVRHGPHA